MIIMQNKIDSIKQAACDYALGFISASQVLEAIADAGFVEGTEDYDKAVITAFETSIKEAREYNAYVEACREYERHRRHDYQPPTDFE